ncbi:MAG: gfo/Idh/MocA family oxidoreductase [Spirochaetaceae bacterium]|nr:MAG: gfo/Idh/MocA family oxidoreductase [Spirochaetaceae bacterium]
MKSIRFGIIGLGLMGREFASACARWLHLPNMEVRPEIIAVCDTNIENAEWFRAICPSVKHVFTSYTDVLSCDDVDAVYCAVPHNLHAKMYCETIRAGKHLLGEKPFGIDLAANEQINAAIAENPHVLVRCSSQFPFTPAMQYICDMLEGGAFGRIIEVESGFLHSSDLNPEKPINWKRILAYNGEYGCMGDLGMHPCHVPFRAGFIPRNVRAVLSNIVTERPDASGRRVPCETWDNATLFCETTDPATGGAFPMTLKMQRIAPGETNTWYFHVRGTEASDRFTTKNINAVEILTYDGSRQNWETVEVGHATAFPSITGGIFEFGFSDAILQMWAGFLYELHHGKPIKKFAGCVTPEEAALSHRLFTAALKSYASATVEPVSSSPKE